MKSIFLSLLVTATLSFAEWKGPSGTERSTTKKDFLSHNLKADRFSEIWNYTFYFNSGTQAYVSYSLNNLPLKGKVFGGELSFQGFQGKNKSVSREYPYPRFAWHESEKTMKLTSKGTTMSLHELPGKGHRVHYSTDKNGGYFLDLTFVSAVKGKVIGDGEFKNGNHVFGQVIHIPQGRVEGRIAVGKDTIEVKGVGVLEHTWQNQMLDDLAGHALQVYKYNSWSGKVLVAEKGDAVLGYGMVKTETGWKAELFQEFLSEGKALKADDNLPKKITLKTNHSELQFHRKKDRQVYSPLENIDGWMARKAVKVALGEIKVRRGTADGVSYSLMDK